MKRLLLLSIFSLILAGCDSNINSDGSLKSAVRTLRIEGCEYLVTEGTNVGSNNYYFSMCHKGNCKNHIHPENR